MADINTEACFTEDIFNSLALRFGYNQLKTFQKDVIKCVLMDKQDAFVSCKTGSGKSLCFRQLLKEISSLREKDSRGLYYVRMELSDLCTTEYSILSFAWT